MVETIKMGSFTFASVALPNGPYQNALKDLQCTGLTPEGFATLTRLLDAATFSYLSFGTTDLEAANRLYETLTDLDLKDKSRLAFVNALAVKRGVIEDCRHMIPGWDETPAESWDLRYWYVCEAIEDRATLQTRAAIGDSFNILH